MTHVHRAKAIVTFWLAAGMVATPLGGLFSVAIGQVELRERGRPSLPSEIRREVADAFGARRAEYRQDQILVRFRGDAKPFRAVAVPHARSVEDLLAEFRGRADIEYAEPDYIAYAFFTPNDPYLNLQWHLNNQTYGGIHATAAWDINRGAGVTVAVVDTGIAYENFGTSFVKAPDLAGTCFVAGYDFINNDSHPNDDNSHGTHVAGTVAQTTNNGVGVAGLAFESCLMPVKVLDRNGSGSYSAVSNGIRFAADNGAKVINLSLGGSVPSATLESAVQYAHGKGVTVVAAAGNENSSAPSYPAAYDAYVISVGATRFDEARAPYSNFGPSVDVVAPGGDTAVDQNADGYGDGVLQNTFNPNTKNARDFGYWFFQGTSMATPHAAALAALVISNGNAVTPDNVRTALQSTADDLGPAGRDDTYGWGLINAPSALAWSVSPVPPPPPPPPPAQCADGIDNDGDSLIDFPADPGCTDSSDNDEIDLLPPPPPPPPPSEIEVFSDSFEVAEWNGLWTEDGQNDWFRSSQRAANGTRSAEVDGSASNAQLISIPIDLQGKSSAVITFSWLIESGLDAGEYLAFDASTDGGSTWTEKARLRGDVDPENVWHAASFDLTGLANLKLRFRGTMSGSSEDANVDMVRVVVR